MRDCHLGTQRATLSERRFQPGVEGMGPGNHHWVSGETFGRSTSMRSNSGKVLGSRSSSTTVIALAGDAGWTRCQKASLLGELERASLGLSLGGSGIFGVSERQIFRERTDSRGKAVS